MGASTIPDSGDARYEVPNDINLKDVADRLRGYFGSKEEFALILEELESRYTPPSNILEDRESREAYASSPAERARQRAANQRQCQMQISGRVDNAVKALALIASLSAAAAVMMEIAQLFKIYNGW